MNIKNRHIDKWKLNQQPEINPCVSAQLIFNEGAKNTWGEEVFKILKMDESWGHFAKWNKFDRERHCIISLVCGILKTKQNKNPNS